MHTYLEIWNVLLLRCLQCDQNKSKRRNHANQSQKSINIKNILLMRSRAKVINIIYKKKYLRSTSNKMHAAAQTHSIKFTM